MSQNNGYRRVYVEEQSGDAFEADIPCGTPLRKVAADFFEERGWPTQDRGGRGRKAVVELVNEQNPDDTKRLNANADICEAIPEDGLTLRIFPESVAGAINQRVYLTALITDHNEMKSLCERNSHVRIAEHRPRRAPSYYKMTFDYRSFIELRPGSDTPRQGDKHEVEIRLGPLYPRYAPMVRWLTPIFHPNIRASDGAVCLGVLREQYRPSLGLVGLVSMLIAMVQYRNFDVSNAFNREAARWAANQAHWKQIEAIGGYPFQGPVDELIAKIDRAIQPRIVFNPLSERGGGA